MTPDEQKERQRLYEKTRDDVNAATRSMSESLDKSLLTLSSGFLGGSLAFVNQVVSLETAEFKWMLYVAWISFAASIVMTVTSLALGILQQRPLHDAAERYYMKGDQSAWTISEKFQRAIFNWVIACGVSFVIGIISLGGFVIINLIRGSEMTTVRVERSVPPATFQKPIVPAPQPAQPQTPQPGGVLEK